MVLKIFTCEQNTGWHGNVWTTSNVYIGGLHQNEQIPQSVCVQSDMEQSNW